MAKSFCNIIEKTSIVDVFKDLYPSHKVVEEVNPFTGDRLYKTFSPFLKSNSKLPQLYFNDKGALHSGYFDFDTGHRGFLPNLLVEKFDDIEDLGMNELIKGKIPKSKKSLEYLFNKFNLNLNKIEKNVL